MDFDKYRGRKTEWRGRTVIIDGERSDGEGVYYALRCADDDSEIRLDRETFCGVLEAECRRDLLEAEKEEKLRRITASGQVHIDECYNPEKLFPQGMKDENGLFAYVKRPAPPRNDAAVWNCRTCGTKNIAGRFCPECGRPSGRWRCACGSINFTPFCPECGSPSECGTRF